uniref:Uncharacterized protein n=1 Tax=Romanomermis culicivorax TaxID=13658 RepID=A0A915HSR2_ROMCU
NTLNKTNNIEICLVLQRFINIPTKFIVENQYIKCDKMFSLKNTNFLESCNKDMENCQNNCIQE